MQGTHFVGFLLLALGVGKSDAFRVLAWSRRPQVRAAPNIVMCATGSNSSDIVQKLNEIASMAAPDADLKERDLALIERERAAAAQKKSDAEALERSLAESVDDAEAFARNLQLANLEGKAEALAAQGNLQGAVEAFDELLKLQPPTSPELSSAAGARRALQQLLLESMRRELDACGSEGCNPHDRPSLLEQTRNAAQAMGEDTRRRLAQRALEDVSRIRSSVLRLLEEAEAQATSDAEEATSNQAYLRLVEGESGWFAGWQFDEARKRISDIRLLRKNVESDLNQLELQLLRGDPSLTWIRELLSRTRGQPDLPAISKGSVWLQEQIASGALPKDPELLRTLLEQARRDPELVVRLVTLAKDKKGKDIYTRALNDPSNFNEF